MANKKIFCANCANCKIFKHYEDHGTYSLRVKCAKKQWLKHSGEEKIYKYFTVARRTMENCPYYEEEGELYPYIKNLKEDLPVRDETY